MAKKKKFDTAITVQLTKEWRDRLRAVADHPRIEDSEASVIRDCIATALPGFEVELGLVEVEEDVVPAGYAGGALRGLPPAEINRLLGKGLSPEEILEEVERREAAEDRSVGCFGGPPRVE